MEDYDYFIKHTRDGWNEIFGERNDFTKWLYDVFEKNSILLVERFNRYNERYYSIIKGFGEEDLDLTNYSYDEAYDYFDYVYNVPEKLSFKIKDVKHPDWPIYQVPLIKALYYSYKHEC